MKKLCILPLHMQRIYEFLKISKQAKEEDYYWAITQAAGRSCCGLSGAIVLEFGFEVSFLVDTCIVDHVYTQFRLGQNMSCASLSERNYCASRGVSVYKTYLIHSIFVLNYAFMSFLHKYLSMLRNISITHTSSLSISRIKIKFFADLVSS